MAEGKIRATSHIVEEKAYRFIQNTLPIEWVQRPISPDYGLDIDVELFEEKSGEYVTLGEHVLLQVKGTEVARYGTIKPIGTRIFTKKELEDAEIPVLKFSIDVPFLKLVERMGSTIPVLLTVVDLKLQKAYFICINDYIRQILVCDNQDYREKQYITIYIPTENILSPEIIRWYGKRTKLYGLFQEILTLVDDVRYMNNEHKIDLVTRRLKHIYNCDGWSARTQWPLLEQLYQQMDDMLSGDLLNDAGRIMLNRYVVEGEDVFERKVSYGSDPTLISVSTMAKVISCNDFLERAAAICACHENSARHMGLPTQIQWLHTH